MFQIYKNYQIHHFNQENLTRFSVLLGISNQGLGFLYELFKEIVIKNASCVSYNSERIGEG